jgi:Fe2+ transport system protein FeoA
LNDRPKPSVPAVLGPVVPLTSVAPGDGCYVVATVEGDDPLAQRLASAGFWPGAIVQCIARAPFGGPLLFRVHGYRLALRRDEAARVFAGVTA